MKKLIIPIIAFIILVGVVSATTDVLTLTTGWDSINSETNCQGMKFEVNNTNISVLNLKVPDNQNSTDLPQEARIYMANASQGYTCTNNDYADCADDCELVASTNLTNYEYEFNYSLSAGDIFYVVVYNYSQGFTRPLKGLTLPIGNEFVAAIKTWNNNDFDGYMIEFMNITTQTSEAPPAQYKNITIDTYYAENYSMTPPSNTTIYVLFNVTNTSIIEVNAEFLNPTDTGDNCTPPSCNSYFMNNSPTNWSYVFNSSGNYSINMTRVFVNDSDGNLYEYATFLQMNWTTQPAPPSTNTSLINITYSYSLPTSTSFATTIILLALLTSAIIIIVLFVKKSSGE
jgi:hypothetical protein